MNRQKNIILLIIFFFLFASCATRAPFRYQVGKQGEKSAAQKSTHYPSMKIVVLSDIHLSEISDAKKTTEKNQNGFAKLLNESSEILNAAVDIISPHDADIVIVPGDFTEFGEFSNHVLVSQALRRIAASGKQVFVVPGNHDIMNYNYVHSRTSGNERPVTAEEFEGIYSDFGFKQAIAKDTFSLSYVAEPTPGLWLIGLDSCRYNENTPDHPAITAGRLNPGTLAWLETMLIRARDENKAVIVFLHHNLLEHYMTQKKYFPDYVLEDNDRIAEMLAHYDVRLVFTGHYHAQDITIRRMDEKKFILDVETGSLVSYPCPIRFVRLDSESDRAFFTSERISSIPSHPDDFTDFSKNSLKRALLENSDSNLSRFGFSATDRKIVSEEAAKVYLAHCEGDEKTPARPWDLTGVGCLYGCILDVFVSDLADGIWQDLPPPDDNIAVDLINGTW
jgi:3',5'-cyclic AMP phosphodiesterase CpdA